MLEDIAHMSRMLGWTGLVAERPAETISHPEGYGLAPDMVIGHIGSVLVGVMASLGSPRNRHVGDVRDRVGRRRARIDRTA
jgi:hypothetical protein